MSTMSTSNPYKIIVGIDYGTTASGISFVTTNKSSDEIVVVTKWPSHNGSAWKTPSLIAYSSENPKLDRSLWGFEVNRGHKHYVWTKLLLDGETNLAKHDDPLLLQMYGSGFLRLPPNKSAKDVVQDYLRELYLYMMQALERELTPRVVKAMPMECWITTPAIWSDRARADTRAAALAAGFGSRSADQVNMISEPEAAALYALKPYLGPKAIDPVKPGEHILICDCGGGTVDLATYEILRTTPSFSHKEKCRGTGAKCGSTSIDRRFVEWMTRTFGAAYTSLDMKKRGPGSSLMKAFELAKRSYGHGDSGTLQYEVDADITMDLDAPSIHYDEDDLRVRIPRAEMKGFFDPAIGALLELVEDQASQLRRISGSKIDRVILVGGFGNSPYLSSRLKEWCDGKGVKRFTCPDDCQAAIVKGAVLRGFDGTRPQSTVAKRHYGWKMHKAFRESIDDEENAIYSMFDNAKQCRGRMHWAVKKGQEMDEFFKVVKNMRHTTLKKRGLHSTVELYSCGLDEAPDRVEDFGVRREGTISVNYRSSPPGKERYNEKMKKTVYRYFYNVEVHFRSESGILEFRTLAEDGSGAGDATITFDY